MARKVIGLVGSLRQRSLNRLLMQNAADLAPSSIAIEVATLHGIPLYDGDVEAKDGVPPAVVELKARLSSAAGVLIATPEYNSGMPGVLKNAIDWCTRPGSDIPSVFGPKPLAIMGATPGSWGTRLAQAAWLPVFRSLGVIPWLGGQLYLAKASGVFDDDGRIVADDARERVASFVSGFASFVERTVAD